MLPIGKNTSLALDPFSDAVHGGIIGGRLL